MKRRVTIRGSVQAVWFTMLLVGSLLAGCGSEPQPNSGATGNAQVSLKMTFPQQAAWLEPVPTLTSRLWAMVETWLPTATAAWARESVSNLSTLRVTVTGDGIQTPRTDEKQLTNPASGDVVTFEVEVPPGENRVFTVDGFKGQLIIFTGRSAPLTLTGGQPVSVEIALADNTGTVSGSIPNGANTGATARMIVQGTTFTAPITSTDTFTFDGVPKGDYLIQVSAPGFISKNVPVVVPAGDTASVGSVVLDPIPPTTGIITGRVINADNQAAIQGATVTVNGLSLSATTTANGSFTILGVPVGAHTLTVNASGFSPKTTATISVTSSTSSSAGTIALTALPITGSVTGTVINVDTRAPIQDATISVAGVSGQSIADGSFTIPGVQAGSHTVTVSATGFFTSTTTSVQVTAGGTSNAGTINLTPAVTTGSITGTVINANTRAAIDRATITVNGLSLTTTSASNGSFTILNMPAGSHALQVSAAGFTSVTTPSIQVTAGNTSQAGTISLSPIITTGTITGTVINADTRAAIPGVRVGVVGSTISTLTIDNGSFRLDGIPQGAQTVLFSRTGFVDTTKIVTVVAGQSVPLGTVPMTGGGSGQLTVSNAPPSVGGTFVVDPLLSSAATSPDLGVGWVERLTAVNGPRAEFVQLSYFPSRGGDIFIEFGVIESTNSVPVVWSCFASSSSSCGVTLNITTRTVTFSNSVLSVPSSNTPPITLNGTLTYPEPVTLP